MRQRCPTYSVCQMLFRYGVLSLCLGKAHLFLRHQGEAMRNDAIKVLVVEDEAIIRMDLVLGLEELGYDVIEANPHPSGIADQDVRAGSKFTCLRGERSWAIPLKRNNSTSRIS